ncbi:hypothetical protein BTR14_06180 [Rhizobium rhizosphaerae]|uniref:Uncharacterized protein n=1 Tax=Xaviernesmea rhizosphaerae TaxID=1672749 RepID=A0ABX3PH18_9HYPH|nr:EAL domain-containing protein [Xaviernesmea rhizosphaerae]OQP87509.1 hypothetical protein BTR14_06180 [Xaviernesmea rhizosphaerae]
MRIGKKTPGRQARSVIWALIIVLAIAFLIGALATRVVSTMGEAADEIDSDRSVDAVEAAVLSVTARLAEANRDNAIWDTSYTALSPEAVSSGAAADWIDRTWGTASADYPLYDGVIVLDGEGRQVAAFFKGKPFAAEQALGSDLLTQSREAMRTSKSAVASFYLKDAQAGWQVALISTLAIQPERPDRDRPPRYTLSFIKLFDEAFLHEIAQSFQVKDLSLAVQPRPGFLSVALDDWQGRPVAYLLWPPLQLGAALYHRVEPVLAGISVLFVLFVIVVVAAAGLEVRRLRQLAQAADHDATHDELTGLLNRNGLIRALAPGQQGVLHLIDLDGFKAVNDSWGHAVGDALLREVGARLTAFDPGRISPARLGGDEFALVQKDGADPALIGTEIVALLARPFRIGARMIEIGASIGFATADSALAPLEIIRRADMALYRAKDAGRAQVVAYDDELDADRQRLAGEEVALKRAIEGGEIAVVYQLLFSAQSGRPTGVEALARWMTPAGMVGPDRFIPLAERVGVIDALFKRVMRQALETLAPWPDLDLSINVSPIQLRNPGFSAEVLALMAAADFPASRLILEITEGVLLDQPERARRAIDKLKQAGVRFAMDDFGTGHTGIGMLRSFGFDTLKVDRTLIASGDDAVLTATIKLAAALSLPVTAEGIETEAQAQTARSAGCEQLQGFLLARPLDRASLDKVLAETLEPGTAPAARTAEANQSDMTAA